MLSRKSISLPTLEANCCRDGITISKRTNKHTQDQPCRRLPPLQEQQHSVNTAFSFGFHFLYDIIGRAHWKRLKLNLRLRIEHLSIRLGFAIKTSQTNTYDVTHLIEIGVYNSVWSARELDSPSKHGASESILSLYPAGDPALVFLWKKKSKLLGGAHMSATKTWKDWD